MSITRRQFLGIAGALTLASRAHGLPFIKKHDKAPVAVAALSDLHLTDARSTAIISRAVKSINENNAVRLSVVIGDISSSARLGEFNLAKTALNGLRQPCLAVPGNHDVELGVPMPYDNFERNFSSADWIYEEEKPWVFIGLDSCDGTASDVAVRPERVEWLRKKLKKISKKRPIGLFAHHPFGPGTKAYRVKNADEVLGMFQEHNLKFVASGHYHGNQEETAGGVLFTTTACCSSTRGNHDNTEQKGYRLFLLDGENVSTRFVAIS